MTVACVTGASGFVGDALVGRLAASGRRVLPAHSGRALNGISELARRTEGELAAALAGVDTVYHLAGLQEGRQHVTAADFHAVNCELTLRLYRAARAADVRKFIWLSTIKVLGEVAETPLSPGAPYAPVGAYALSKAQGEQALLAAADGSTGLVILRSPLVYGPGAKGNFAALLRLCRSGLPLPLATADARRSMVGLANLVDLLARLATVDLGATDILHVRDAKEWRVVELARAMQRLAGHPSRQFPVSRKFAESFARCLGRPGAPSRLFDPLRVEAESSERRVGWQPPHASEQLLPETVAWMSSKR